MTDLQRRLAENEAHAYTKIVLVEPGRPQYGLHYCLVAGEVLMIQFDEFVDEVSRGCELWLDARKDTERCETNYRHIARRHPDGLAPYVVGDPVVG